MSRPSHKGLPPNPVLKKRPCPKRNCKGLMNITSIQYRNKKTRSFKNQEMVYEYECPKCFKHIPANLGGQVDEDKIQRRS